MLKFLDFFYPSNLILNNLLYIYIFYKDKLFFFNKNSDVPGIIKFVPLTSLNIKNILRFKKQNFS
jgi:hypothetical protein